MSPERSSTKTKSSLRFTAPDFLVRILLMVAFDIFAVWFVSNSFANGFFPLAILILVVAALQAERSELVDDIVEIGLGHIHLIERLHGRQPGRRPRLGAAFLLGRHYKRSVICRPHER